MKDSKIFVTIAIFSAFLVSAGCAEKSVRGEAKHEHMHSGQHKEMMRQPMQSMPSSQMQERMESMMQEMERAVEQARTREDHEAIAATYERKAARMLKMARHHERLADVYARTDNPKMAGDSARHCRNIARRLREAAEEMQSLARMHRQLGGQ